MHIYDIHDNKFPLEDLWRARPVLISWIRHYG